MKRNTIASLLLTGLVLGIPLSVNAQEVDSVNATTTNETEEKDKEKEKDTVTKNFENLDTELIETVNKNAKNLKTEAEKSGNDNLKDLKSNGQDLLDENIKDFNTNLENVGNADEAFDLIDSTLTNLSKDADGLVNDTITDLQGDAKDVVQDGFSNLQNDAKELVKGKLSNIGNDIVNGIKDQFSSIFGDVVGFFKGVENINQDILDVATPDWNVVQETVESTDTASKELGQQLESRTSDSFHSVKNEAESLQRELIAEAISQSTTSIEAQEATAETITQVQEVLERSGELSEDSAGSDVSQQILQNLSEQAGIGTQLSGIAVSQNIQAQKDRANQINLALQNARHASIANNRARREALLASESGTSAWGIVGTPIFLYEETP